MRKEVPINDPSETVETVYRLKQEIDSATDAQNGGRRHVFSQPDPNVLDMRSAMIRNIRTSFLLGFRFFRRSAGHWPSDIET